MPRLSPSASRSAAPKRQRAVLDGMMFIDLQIAAAFEVQGKSAVFCDLFEHVIEESQAAGDRARALARQVDLDS